jgi:hypothetical protein
MNDNNYKEAKEIYIKHGGNYFFMDRGDEPLFEKYKSFSVPKELEKQWDREIEEGLLLKIKNEKNMNMLRIYYSSLESLFARTKNIKGLLYLKNILYENRYDTFTSLLLTEAIFADIEYFILVDKALTLQISKETLDFLKKLLEGTITISSDYSFHSVEEIKKRINKRIKEYEDKLDLF